MSGNTVALNSTGSKKQLKNFRGDVLLERSVVGGGLLYVYDPATHVDKADLEELLDVTIIEKKHAPQVTKGSGGYGLADFRVGGVGYSYTESAQNFRESAFRLLTAADEIDRHNAEKEARAEKKRLKDLEENGKKRREISALRDALYEEGILYPQSVAESLYAAGVRANG